MPNRFFDQPILNSPYEYPKRHWELDESGQPTRRVLDSRRGAKFVTPIPKPKKHKKQKKGSQKELVFDEGSGRSTEKQQYDPTSIINEVRSHVDAWRALPNASQWQVTPETARLLQHWRHHQFSDVRPFFCQIEAVETAIWLTEVAPNTASGKQILDYLVAANKDANPAEIDVIWENWQVELEPLCEKINTALKQHWQEWEIPREADEAWSEAVKKLHAEWREVRIARQKEIDASIAAKAEFEYLYDKPIQTTGRSASLVPSPSRASARTASSASMRMTS